MAVFAVGEGWHIRDAAGRRKYVSSAERAGFLRAADQLALRDRALCHTLAYAGCRISEALALTLHHVDAERFTVTLRTLKRRKLVFRTVPVPESLIEMLYRLPITPDGRFWPIHRTTAWRVIKATMRHAGVTGPMASPKGLRHGFGIREADCSIPTNLIQRWMGHASPTTTAIYLDAVGLEERRFASRMW